MSTKLWIGDKMYLVDEEVYERFIEMQECIDSMASLFDLPKKNCNIIPPAILEPLKVQIEKLRTKKEGER